MNASSVPLTTGDLTNLTEIVLGIVITVFLCFVLFQLGMLLRDVRRVVEKANTVAEMARDLIGKPMAIISSVQEGIRGVIARFSHRNDEDEDVTGADGASPNDR